jgi:hypothetical protein
MHKKISIMQPYFLPYIGYWQLIKNADEFIVYDAIKYTKKGWINRNRFLSNGTDKIFSLPLKSASDYLNIRDRELALNFNPDDLVKQFEGAYKKAPYFKDHFSVIESILYYKKMNLFIYLLHSIQKICTFLDIKTPIIISSDIQSEHESLGGQDKVINLCTSRNANSYINPIGGIDLYNKDDFLMHGITLSFLRARVLDYKCFENNAIPHMSILDVMMFCSRDQIVSYLHEFDEV